MAVTILTYLFSLSWVGLRYLVLSHQWSVEVENFSPTDWTAYLWGGPIIVLPQQVVVFALSISVTRFIATLAAALCTSAASSAFTFAALLVGHVVLLLFWSTFVLVLLALPVWLIMGRNPISEALRVLPGEFKMRGALGMPLDWSLVFSWHLKSDWPPQDISFRVFKAIMDLLANGVRIVLALVFLSSFVFRPLIQEPISRLWYGAMNSDKPVFTTLFGAVGAVVAAVSVISK